MVNLKPVVLGALKNSAELTQQLGTGTKVHFHYPPDFINLPCVTYRQEDNEGELYADDEEIGSRISFIIDVWGKQSLSTIVDTVDGIMKDLGFYRTVCTDLFEADTKIYHVAMRFITLAE